MYWAVLNATGVCYVLRLADRTSLDGATSLESSVVGRCFVRNLIPSARTCSVSTLLALPAVAIRTTVVVAAGSFDGGPLIYDPADSCDVLKACSNIMTIRIDNQ